MEIEEPQNNSQFKESQSETSLRIKLPPKSIIKQASIEAKKRIMIKINKQAFGVTSKLGILQKKLPASVPLSNFIKSELVVEEQIKHSFINRELPMADFENNMRFLFKLGKKISLLVENLIEINLVKFKILKFLSKLVQKLVKIFHTYLFFVHEPVNSGFELTNFEVEELNSFSKRLRIKIDDQTKEPDSAEKQEMKASNIIKIPSRNALAQTVQQPAPSMKFKFERKDLGLSNELKKIREEAEKLNFNDFENRKEQFKDEIRNYESIVQSSIQGLLSSIHFEDNLPSQQFQFAKINQTPQPKKNETNRLPEAQEFTVEGPSIFDMVASNFIDKATIENRARFIQDFWRFHHHKKTHLNILKIKVNPSAIENSASQSKGHLSHSNDLFAGRNHPKEQTGMLMEDIEDEQDEDLEQMAREFEQKIRQMSSNPKSENPKVLPETPFDSSIIPIELPINADEFIKL